MVAVLGRPTAGDVPLCGRVLRRREAGPVDVGRGTRGSGAAGAVLPSLPHLPPGGLRVLPDHGAGELGRRGGGPRPGGVASADGRAPARPLAGPACLPAL